MFRSLVIMGVLIFTAIPAMGQTNDDVEISAFLNRISATLRLAHGESKNADSDLELVEEQKSQLAALRAEYKKMVQEYAELESVEGNDRAAIGKLLSELPRLEKKLTDEILLPHQVQILQSKVFDKFVLEHNGNLLKAMASYYPHEFQLNETQKKQLKEIEDRAAKELAELKKRYEQELLGIRTKAREDARQTLTKEQLKVLGKYQDVQPRQDARSPKRARADRNR